MDKRLKGSLLVFLSALCWSFSGVLGKDLAWNGLSKGGVRSIVAVAIYALYRRTLRVKLTKSTVIGALGVASTSTLYMLALTMTTSANAITLQYSMPLYVALISFLFFGVKPDRRQLIALPLLMAGMALCCLGKGVGSTPLPRQGLGNALALLSGLTFSLVFVASRMKGADPLEYTYLGICLTMLLSLGLPFDENVRWGAGTASDFLKVAAMGVSLGLGYLLLALGLKTASPTTAAILENLEPVLNPVWVFLFLGERPDATGLIGCALVLVTVTVYSCLPQGKNDNENGETNGHCENARIGRADRRSEEEKKIG